MYQLRKLENNLESVLKKFNVTETIDIKLTKNELSLFSKWNNVDPVDEWECKKLKLIVNSQKNLNKFIGQGCKASD